jgi:hypothetical protein
MGAQNIHTQGKGFGRVHLWWFQALRDADAGVMARDVLVVISSYADRRTGQAYPSIATIAELLGVGQRAVKAAIRELKMIGLLESTRRSRRSGQSNLYHLAVNGHPFQVSDSDTYKDHHQVHSADTYTGDNQVSKADTYSDQVPDSDTYKATLGVQGDPDQVHTSRHFQGRDLCSNAASNLPVEPTSEPSVLTSFVPGETRSRSSASEDPDKIPNETRQEIRGLLDDWYLDKERAQKDADWLLRRHSHCPTLLRENLRFALSQKLEDPVEYANRKTQRGERPHIVTGAVA